MAFVPLIPEEENNDTVYSALGHIKRKMGANKRSGVLTEKETSMVDMQFMNFVSSALSNVHPGPAALLLLLC